MSEHLSSYIAFGPALAPALLGAVALVARGEPGPRPRRVLRLCRVATLVALALAAATDVLVALCGPLATPVLGPASIGGVGGLGLALRLDPLSAALFALIAFLGAIIVQYSRNYLDGDPRQGRFLGDLCLTLGAVALLVLSGTLVQLAAAWIGTSLALHRLLVFFPQRRDAVIAARKKFLCARTSDLALLVACALLIAAFGTADLAALLDRARAALQAGVVPPTVGVAAALIAVAAALKSAQFPTHGWLAEVMGTPTPVSALLHAGILNGGTFLVVRLAQVMVLSPGALHALVVIGGFTALFASVVMVTQTSVKVALAYSSAAHMGFMLLLCGLGAFPVAIMHLIAHSCYKAHAFLSAGSAVELQRAAPDRAASVSPLRIAAAAVLSIGTFFAVALVCGATPWERPVSLGLGIFLMLGFIHLIVAGLDDAPSAPSLYVLGRTVLAAAATAGSFFLVEFVGTRVLAAALPLAPPPGAATLALLALVLGAGAAVVLLQVMLSRGDLSPRWRAVYVHVRNGLYANALFDRAIGALALAGRPHAQESRP